MLSNILSYVFHTERKYPVAWDAIEPVFFLSLHFHAAVAENASLLMRTRKLPYMAYKPVNYALFYISNLYHIVFVSFWEES